MLVRLLALLAAAAIAASAVLVFVVLPAAARFSRQAITEIGDVEHARTLLSGQSNDERGFLLSGNEHFLIDFDAKGALLSSILDRLRRDTSATERPLFEAAVVSYGRYLAQHEQVLALARQGRLQEASALALTDERTVRLETDALLEAAHERVVAESRREQGANRRRATVLTAVLLVLGFAPALGAYLLGRTLRRLDEEEAANIERRRLADAQRIAHLGSWEHDFASGTTTWSDELFRIFGHEPGAFVPTVDAFVATTHPEDQSAVAEQVARGPAEGSKFAFRCRVVRPDGSVRWTETQGEFVLAAHGSPMTVFGTALDVTERQAAADEISRSRKQLVDQEAEMRHRAYHDALTGLPNRSLLLERLDHALTDALPVAVLVLDLDGFKRINDSLGHAVGDQLLVGLGERLARSVRLTREGDAPVAVDHRARRHPPDTVARLGGDEFAILLVDVDEDSAREVAERVIAECAAPFTFDGRRLVVSASMGLVLRSRDATSADLLRDADVAMYAAKDAGKARYAVFDPAMRATVVERLALEDELRAAVESQGLALHYQPVIDVRSGAVVKVEALVRWPHPQRGMIGPDRFIPLAEETGLIVPLGAWVLHEACHELIRQSERHQELKVAVNVSPRQLDDDSLVGTVRAALEQSGLAPSRLVLEVTESALVEQDAVALGALEALDRLGVGLSIDDFGTGYSSLSRLRLLPVSELKIDKSFIDEVDIEGERAPVVAAVIALAHGLDRTVVAEGVETAGQLASLSRLGCDTVQGFLYSRPLPPAELAELLAFPTPFADLAPHDVAPHDTELQEIMAAVEQAVRAGGELDAAVRPLLAELTRVTGMETAYLTGIAPHLGTHEVLASYNAGDLDVPEGGPTPWVDSLCHRALTVGPRRTEDVPHDYPDNAVATALGIHSYAMVPVTTTQGRLVGTLCAASRSSCTVDTGTVRLMEVFARLLAEAFERRDEPRLEGVQVVVVDDSPLVQGLVRRVLTSGPGIEVVAEARNGEEAVHVCRTHRPDVVVLDLNIGGTDGLTVLPSVREVCPDAKVVVLSAQAHVRRAEALAAGADAVVDKQDGIEHLRAVVAAVL